MAPAVSDYVQFGGHEKRPCWVRPDRERWPDHADQEWPGLVAAWRRKGGRWQAYVEFSTGMGETPRRMVRPGPATPARLGPAIGVA